MSRTYSLQLFNNRSMGLKFYFVVSVGREGPVPRERSAMHQREYHNFSKSFALLQKGTRSNIPPDFNQLR